MFIKETGKLLLANKIQLDNSNANQYEQWLNMTDVDTINICCQKLNAMALLVIDIF